MAKQLASILSFALAATSVNAHAIFHSATVNGASKGQLFGVRAPDSNSPIQDVTSSAITCNTGLHQPVSHDVIEVAPGDKFGMQWNHVIDGPQGSGDSDDPIASSHKGPVMVYMAKVDDASTADGSGLKWFKVAQEGLDTSTGRWGVDTLIANKGLWTFTMPGLTAGDYLLRGEVLALHSAGSQGGAQFYMSCAGIRVTGSGTCSPSDTVSFPGAYSATDPGILISIYGNTGKPDNGGKAYTAPGPSVVTCDGSSSSSPSSSKPAASASASVSTANNHASTSGATGGAAVTSADATSKTTTTPKPSIPTTLATVTTSRSALFSNSTSTDEPCPSWTEWTGPEPTNTQPAKPHTTSNVPHTASGLPKTTPSQGSQGSVPSSNVDITASSIETGVKVPNASSTSASSPSKAPVEPTKPSSPAGTGSVPVNTSPAQPSGQGYPMTGPGGKKFVCYEVTNF